MSSILSDDYAEFCRVYYVNATSGLRVNTLKIEPANLVTNLKIPLEEIAWCQTGYLIKGDDRPGKHPYHSAGLYYLQEPSAMSVAEILDPKPGERILDIAAAPGGKTTHIASLMNNEGFLLANDVHPTRVRDLTKNLERCGVRNASITQETPERLANHFGGVFDRVLVDAPCSGEGMFRKDKGSIKDWSVKQVVGSSYRQQKILADAAKLVKNGGVLVYSTCTFAPEENEGTLNAFLDDHPDFELAHIQKDHGWSSGLMEWNGKAYDHPLDRAIRIYPHKSTGEGHFIAKMTKSKSADDLRGKDAKYKIKILENKHYKAFVDTYIKPNVLPEHVFKAGSYLYSLPNDYLSLMGLNIVHWGWFLGIDKGNRFEPSQWLAQGLRLDEVRNPLSFRLGNPALIQYIRGITTSHSEGKGWVLVGVDGYPLGWGKAVNGKLKSRSPKWLRTIL